MAEVAISDEYKRSLEKLSKEDANKIKHLLVDIQDDNLTNGVHEEKIPTQDGKILKSFRASDDLRLVLYKWRKDEWLAITCGHHDATYERIKNIRLETQKNAELPVVKIVISKQPDPYSKPRPEVPETKPVSEKKTFAFGQMPDEHLIKIGVPREDLPKLRAAQTDEHILRLIDDYEVPVQERIHKLVDNPLMLQELVDEASREKPRRPLKQIVKTSPADAANYFMLTDELMVPFFAGKLENWQVFLHQDQARAVEMEANGPVMITGTAGTGKTVVAVHRAKWLLDNNKIGAGRKVLFTTYTRTLIDSARSMLSKICTHGQVELVDVINLDELLRKEWAKFRKGGKIEYPEGGETGIIGEVVEAVTGSAKDMKWSKEFIAAEYEKVILENGITTLEEYEQVTRSGLLRKISKKSRQTLWPFFAQMNERFRKDEDKKLPKSAVLNLLTEAIRNGRYRPEVKYDSIIVDEAQDFGAPEYRFVAAITGNTYSNPRPDSLYIVGDGYQRIYGRNGSLKECQINVHSRSRHLTVCYRSTKRIREYAQDIIAGIAAPNMNGDPENMGNVLSLETGEYPLERFFANKNYGHMKHFMAAKIKSWHGSGICYKDIAILVRNAGTANNPEKYLFGVRMDMEELGIPASIVSKKYPSLDGDTVKIMTMHRAKGLQFISVIIDLSRWPHKIDDADEEQQAENLKQEKLLLYMSVMRATTNVVITGVKGRPQELPVFVPEKCIEDEPPQALPAQPIEQVSGSENLSIYDKFIAYLESIKRGFGIARQYRREISAPLPEDIMARASAISSYNRHEGDLAADWAYFAKKNAVTLTLREAAKMSARNEN